MKIEHNKNNVINFKDLEIGDCFRVKNNNKNPIIYMKLINNYNVRGDDGHYDVNTVCLDANTLVFFPEECEVVKVDYSLCVND